MAVTWPPVPIRFVASKVFCVFAHMHARGVLYRDLKPENVLLDARAHVRLVDFRLALIGTDWSL
jgi:serine/threonine protein kinase